MHLAPLSPGSLPAGPPPRREQGLRWLFQPYAFLSECAQAYGDVFTVDLGSYGSFVLFSHPQAIRTIFTGDPNVFHAGAGNAVLRPFLGAGSLLLLEGERHIAERRLLLPAFHGKRVADWEPIIREVVVEATAKWQPGQLMRVQDAMQEIALGVILRVVFGFHDGSSRELSDLLQKFLNDSKFNLALISLLDDDLGGQETWRGFRESFQRIHELVDAEIAHRRTHESERGDMLSLLSQAQLENGETLSGEELRDELLTLVVTGYETTATALAWAFYWIYREPAVFARLCDELLAGETADAASTSAYLDAVCKEVLRIHPVIPIVARQLQAPARIEDYDLPAGVTVAPCIFLTHHREDLYPEPDRFRPERFLERTYSPYEYLPFGGGSRRCIGMPLAIWEMKVVLASVLSRCRLELLDLEKVRPQRRSVTVAPSGGPLMRVLDVAR